MTYFLLSIIVVQAVVILLLSRFVLKHFTLTIEHARELSRKEAVNQAKNDVNEFLDDLVRR